MSRFPDFRFCARGERVRTLRSLAEQRSPRSRSSRSRYYVLHLCFANQSLLVLSRSSSVLRHFGLWEFALSRLFLRVVDLVMCFAARSFSCWHFRLRFLLVFYGPRSHFPFAWVHPFSPLYRRSHLFVQNYFQICWAVFCLCGQDQGSYRNFLNCFVITLLLFLNTSDNQNAHTLEGRGETLGWERGYLGKTSYWGC